MATRAQWFQVGGIILGTAVAVAGFVAPTSDAALVAQIGGAIVGGYSAIGAVLFGPSAAAQAAIANIDDPRVKLALAQAVSQLPGVFGGLTIDRTKATPELVAAAESRTPENSKIELKR